MFLSKASSDNSILKTSKLEFTNYIPGYVSKFIKLFNLHNASIAPSLLFF